MALNPRLNDRTTPLVSMLVFNYNYGRYLRECFDSVLAQSYDNIEIIFSDNASTDESWEIALEYQRLYPDTFFIARNRCNFGTDANFRNCWINARGKYFVELCSDDALLPDFAEQCVTALEEHPDTGFAMVHRTILDENGKRVLEAPFYDQTCKIPGPAQAAVYMMAAVNPAVSQIMYRRIFTEQKTVVGGLAARWYGTRIMDFNMCCEYPMIYIKEPLMLHRLHLSNDSFKAATNLMEVIGPYVLNHQFAEIASFRNHQGVVDRLEPSIEKLANLGLRYGVRSLINGDERGARRYHDLAMALWPEIRNSDVCAQLSNYWTLSDPAEKRQLITSLEVRDNLVTRSISYPPPPGSTPLR